VSIRSKACFAGAWLPPVEKQPRAFFNLAGRVFAQFAMGERRKSQGFVQQ
jgi:hypothetical protein